LNLKQLPFEQLSPEQQLILSCVGELSGTLSRSEVAKLLTGSGSTRIAEFADNPFFGRLVDCGRKDITFEIDILLQQGYLALDTGNKLILGSQNPGS